MIHDLYEVHQGSLRNYHQDGYGINLDTNPLEDIYQRVEHKYHYRAEETGLYHPEKKQVLKLRNNGAIDLFASKEIGIRLDPNSETAHVFANHYKKHLHHLTAWLTGNEERYAKGHRYLKTGGKTTIQAKQDMKLLTNENLIIEVGRDKRVKVKGDIDIEVDGNLNANVKGHATIKAEGNINLRSNKDIFIVASGDLHLDGRKLYIGG